MRQQSKITNKIYIFLRKEERSTAGPLGPVYMHKRTTFLKGKKKAEQTRKDKKRQFSKRKAFSISNSNILRQKKPKLLKV
jgi:hypothetical protein